MKRILVLLVCLAVLVVGVLPACAQSKKVDSPKTTLAVSPFNIGGVKVGDTKDSIVKKYGAVDGENVKLRYLNTNPAEAMKWDLDVCKEYKLDNKCYLIDYGIDREFCFDQNNKLVYVHIYPIDRYVYDDKSGESVKIGDGEKDGKGLTVDSTLDDIKRAYGKNVKVLQIAPTSSYREDEYNLIGGSEDFDRSTEYVVQVNDEKSKTAIVFYLRKNYEDASWHIKSLGKDVLLVAEIRVKKLL